jgi:hypothetical protein
MLTLRPHLRRLSWIAILAVSGLALAPTLSHALAFVQGGKSALAEVCTPRGTQLMTADDAAADSRAPSTGAHRLEHCPYCASGASALGLPPTPVAALSLPLAGADVPSAWLRVPPTLFAWAAAQPRAPPILR